MGVWAAAAAAAAASASAAGINGLKNAGPVVEVVGYKFRPEWVDRFSRACLGHLAHTLVGKRRSRRHIWSEVM